MDKEIINVDKQINEFKKNLLLTINNSGLPITIICLVLHEITNACDERQRIVLNELYMKEQKKEEQKEVKKDGTD